MIDSEQVRALGPLERVRLELARNKKHRYADPSVTVVVLDEREGALLSEQLTPEERQWVRWQVLR